MYYVYLLKSDNHEEIYVGSTSDLERRLKQHNGGEEISTKRYAPWKVVYYEAYNSERLAREREQKLKHHGSAMRGLKERIGILDQKEGASPRPTFSKEGRVHPAPLLPRKSRAGFTMIEILVALGLFAIVSLGVYFSYINILDAILSSQLKQAAIAIANNEIEFVRGLSYGDVGIQGGAPAGVLESQRTVLYGNTPFVIETFVRNIDDPFDGVLGGGGATSPPTNQLVGHWTLDDADISGDNVFDSTTNNNDGTKQGTGGANNKPQSTAGKIGEALDFDGDDDEVIIPDSPSLSFGAGSDFSFHVWVKTTNCSSLASGKKMLEKKSGGTSVRLQCNDDTVEFGVRDSNYIRADAGAVSPIDDDQWHHIVGVKEGNDVSLYVDGVLKATDNSSFTGNWNQGDVRIGNSASGGDRDWDGQIDNVLIYSRPLTDQEVLTLYGSTGPNDTAPADYRLVTFRVTCPTCPRFTPQKIEMATIAAPRGLENTTNNGNLFVNVFDANGLPVASADVHVENTVLNPTITIDDETNSGGILQLVDISTSTVAYEITVTKDGYSTEKTYAASDFGSSTPVKLHSTVAEQTITEISFAIDQLSDYAVSTSDQFCQLVGNVGFDLEGTKLVATVPDVKKYSVSTTTDANGSKILPLEWDTYTLTPTDATYYFSGFTPASATTTVDPNMNYVFNAIVEPQDASGLLVTVLDESSVPINDASVRLTGPSTDVTLLSGRRLFTATDWSVNQYFSQDGGIDADNPAGELHLVDLGGGTYATSTESWLISNTVDFGGASTFRTIRWNPESQPPQTGPDSLRFQIATNNDQGTWNFVGPDGSAGTYYTTSSSTVASVHNNNRYFRYKVYMKTADTNFTPSLEDITVEFTSPCTPAGQVFFNGLSSGNYTISVARTGFEFLPESASVASDSWQEKIITASAGMIAYWTMDDADISGGTLLDKSGQGNDATIVSATTGAVGQIGQAFEFDGTNDYLVIPDTDILSGGAGKDFTWALWIYPHQWSSRHIMRKDLNSSFKDWGFRWDNSGKITFYYENGGSNDDPCNCPSDYIFPINTWTFVAVTYDGSTRMLSFFIDGGFDVNGGPLQFDLPNSDAELHIGRRSYSSSSFFDGLLDDIRIYDRILNPDEITALYNAGNP